MSSSHAASALRRSRACSSAARRCCCRSFSFAASWNGSSASAGGFRARRAPLSRSMSAASDAYCASRSASCAYASCAFSARATSTTAIPPFSCFAGAAGGGSARKKKTAPPRAAKNRTARAPQISLRRFSQKPPPCAFSCGISSTSRKAPAFKSTGQEARPVHHALARAYPYFLI